MSTGGETNFLFAVLLAHGYNPYEQNCTLLLTALIQRNERAFLQICYDLVKSIAKASLMPLSKLDDSILEPIVDDLSKILTPLYEMQKYDGLVQTLHKAQNKFDNAIGEKSKRSKDSFIREGFIEVDTFCKVLEEILEENC